MSTAEGSAGRSPVSNPDELMNVRFFTPEREARSDEDKRIGESRIVRSVMGRHFLLV
jgi:hypothetical protein